MIRQIIVCIKARKLFFLFSVIAFAMLYSLFTCIFTVSTKPFTDAGPFFTIFSVLGLVSISFLSAVLLTLQYHALREKKKSSAKTKASFFGYLGTTGSLFATVCPFCKPLLVAILGLGGAFGFLQVYGKYITFLSAMILIVAIYLITQTKKSCCNV